MFNLTCPANHLVILGEYDVSFEFYKGKLTIIFYCGQCNEHYHYEVNGKVI